MAKIYRVIQIKLNQIVKNVHMITDLGLPTKRINAITVTNISQGFYLQDGGKNQLEQNYVTVTLICISHTGDTVYAYTPVRIQLLRLFIR